MSNTAQQPQKPKVTITRAQQAALDTCRINIRAVLEGSIPIRTK